MKPQPIRRRLFNTRTTTQHDTSNDLATVRLAKLLNLNTAIHDNKLKKALLAKF